jgi:hypothetical protein
MDNNEKLSLAAKEEWQKGNRSVRMTLERLFYDVDFEPKEYLIGEELIIQIAIEVTDIDKYSDTPYEITAARIGDEEEPLMVEWFSAEELNKLIIKEQ